MNLTLIGMAGAGKSYIGKPLAEHLGLELIDNDILLAEAHGKGIQSILDELGEESYLEEEARTLIESTKGKDGLIIAPGGSIIYRDDAMDHVKDISAIIYIKVPYETVESRLRDLPPRAIIGLGRKTLRELYDERHPLYEANADLVVEPDKLSSDQLIGKVLDFLGVDRKPSPDNL